MTEIEAAKLIKVLQEAYPRAEFTEGRIEVYTLMLSDLPYEAAQKAVLKLIATSPFLPTIAEIRKTAAEYMYERLPDVDDAYAEAREFAKHRYNPNDGPLSAAQLQAAGLRPLTARALASVGVDVMALTDEPSVVAAQFKAAYQRLVESVKEQRVVPPAALPHHMGRGQLTATKAYMEFPEMKRIAEGRVGVYTGGATGYDVGGSSDV